MKPFRIAAATLTALTIFAGTAATATAAPAAPARKAAVTLEKERAITFSYVTEKER